MSRPQRPHNPLWQLDPSGIEKRLKAPPTLLEFVALTTVVVAVAFIAFFVLDPTAEAREIGWDWEVFKAAANDETPYHGYYYFNPYWLLPLFQLVQLTGDPLGFFVWMMLNLGGAYFAARVFGGRVVPLVFGLQMFLFILLKGQITGIMLFGFGLLWWALHRRRLYLAGFAMLFSVIKYQWGIPITLAMWLMADLTWRERLRVLILPAGVALLSLVAYPLWPLEVLADFQKAPPEDSGSIALWRWIGPAVFLFWIPVLGLPMHKHRRLIAIMAALMFAVPYIQQADLIALYALPVGHIGWLGNIGILFLLIHPDTSSLRWLFFIPMLVYAWVLWEPFKTWWRGKRAGQSRLDDTSAASTA